MLVLDDGYPSEESISPREGIPMMMREGRVGEREIEKEMDRDKRKDEMEDEDRRKQTISDASEDEFAEEIMDIKWNERISEYKCIHPKDSLQYIRNQSNA